MTPTVTISPTPAPNDWGYKGPAAHNPYFHTTGIAPDYGFVPNFYGWFQAVAVYNITTGNVDHYIDPRACASLEGAQEALRLVHMFEPGARLEWIRVEEGGLYYADRLTPQIVLPGACRLNAGTVLNNYYHGGAGVSAESDMALAAELGIVLPDLTDPIQPAPESPAEVPQHPVTTSPVGDPDADGDYGTLPGSEQYAVGEKTNADPRGVFVMCSKETPLGFSRFWRLAE
jgi:hypothetical protein